MKARIVGVAANVKHSGRGFEEAHLIGDIYFSQNQLPVASQVLLIRYRGDAAVALQAAKKVLTQFDPRLALTDASTMDDRLADRAIARNTASGAPRSGCARRGSSGPRQRGGADAPRRPGRDGDSRASHGAHRPAARPAFRIDAATASPPRGAVTHDREALAGGPRQPTA